MTDAWNMTGGQVYVAPVGADPKDPSRWHQLGTLTEMEMRQDDGWYGGGRTNVLTTRGPLTLFKPEPVKARMSYEFTFNTKPHSLDALALYYGTDVKSAGIVNNRGEARKEEKHMGVRKFKSRYDVDIEVKGSEHGAQLGVKATHGVLLKHADVPLIAHALFEKSGWPEAVQDDDGDWAVKSDGGFTRWGFKVNGKQDADKALATAISALAAYNAWVEGAAARLEAEVAAEAARVEAEERRAAENARKREHDALRTSAIALEALELYNANCLTSHESWDATQNGHGRPDDRVRHWIAKAEAARAGKPAPKIGDRVRVSWPAKTAQGIGVHFGKEVEALVAEPVDSDGDILVTTDDRGSNASSQYVDPKYVTVLATAEDLAAEKAKAERDAGIAALMKADHSMASWTAERLYDRGIRATA